MSTKLCVLHIFYITFYSSFIFVFSLNSYDIIILLLYYILHIITSFIYAFTVFVTPQFTLVCYYSNTLHLVNIFFLLGSVIIVSIPHFVCCVHMSGDQVTCHPDYMFLNWAFIINTWTGIIYPSYGWMDGWGGYVNVQMRNVTDG